MKDTIRIATRKSTLAMWQARHVESLLEDRYPEAFIELVPIVTEGDRIQDRPLAQIGGKGLFLKELEIALLSGEADMAVHSMKDVPAVMTPGLCLDVVLPRANPYDALVCLSNCTLDQLPFSARVGTSSLRRKCQLLSLRPDLEVADLRGNVDTRLKKLEAGKYEAIILACAGLERLGLEDWISQQLLPPDWVPASTQGIIGLQCRADDERLLERISVFNDPVTMIQARAERTVARELEGSCQLPLAVFAQTDKKLKLTAMVGTPDGSTLLRASRSSSLNEPEALGMLVARDLLDKGAGEIIRRLQA